MNMKNTNKLTEADLKWWLVANGLPLFPANGLAHAKRLLKSPDSLTNSQRVYLRLFVTDNSGVDSK